MKISNFYLNSLLSGLVVLLTFVLVLLYLIQTGDQAIVSHASSTQEDPATYAEIQSIEAQIGALEGLLAKQNTLAKKEKIAQSLKSEQLNTQIGDLTTQLEATRTSEQQALEQLKLNQQLIEELQQGLNREKNLALEKSTALATSDAQLEAVSDSLEQEKQYIQTLRVDYEKEKLFRSNLSAELELKKRELMRSKRNLARSTKALSTKIRELTISKSKVNNIYRQNNALQQPLSIPNKAPQRPDQTSRDQAIVSDAKTAAEPVN